MRRVAVIGSGGSGKSTFARELGARTRLPVIHLDRLFWKPGWVPTPDEEWRALQVALVREDEWILDGNYSRTLDVRLAAADTVFFFDTPTWLNVAGVLRRWARHHGHAVQADGCPERASPAFLLWVRVEPMLIGTQDGDVEVTVPASLRTDEQVDRPRRLS